jgi:hypothetical protein
MSTLKGVGLGACLLGMLLLGCSRPGPPPPNLATDAPAPTSSTAPASADSADVKKGAKKKGAKENGTKETKVVKQSDQEAYKTAMNACSADAQKKTMGSILAIFTRLRPGAYSANYADCMKTHGIDVSK